MTVADAVVTLVVVARGEKEGGLVVSARAWGGMGEEGELFEDLRALIGLMGLLGGGLGMLRSMI